MTNEKEARRRALQQQIITQEYELQQMDLKFRSRCEEHARRVNNHERNRPLLVKHIEDMKKELENGIV